jgi:hypothetical protein
LFSEIGHLLNMAAGSGHHRAASDVIKWLAVQFGPEIIDLNSEWILTKDGTMAFPRNSMETPSIAHLFERLRSVREHFRLASSDELSKLGVNGGFELVRDALGDNFSYEPEDLITGQVRAWNGAEVVIVPKWQVNTGPFQWRPRFSLPA